MNKKRKKILFSLSLILISSFTLIFFTTTLFASPLVNFNSPNNIYSTNPTQIFRINITDSTPIQSVQLYIWNSTGNKVNVGRAGNMWATVTTTTAVSKVLPNGTIVANYTATGNSPWAIAFDGVNMWTANTGGNSVTKVFPNGTMITYSGTGVNPNDIAFDGVNMWTANNGGPSVTKVLPNGTMITYSGGSLSAPSGIAFDGVNMWVTNTGGNSVTEVTPNGTMINFPGTGCNPVGIAFDGVNMWTSNYGCSSVTKVFPNGTMITYPGTGTSNYKIAFDGLNMWTSNAGPGSSPGNITKVTPNGTMTNYTGGPSGYYPFGIAFDGVNMWAANEGGNVQKILPNGTFIFYNGTAFGNVGGIAFDGATLVPPFNYLNLTPLSGTSNSTNWTVTLPGNGVYTWNVIGVDSAGNYAFNSTNYTITVSNAPPAITIISPTNSSYNSITQLAYSVSDIIPLASCWYSTNGGITNSSIDPTCSNFTISASTGLNNWTVYANDTAGNFGSASTTFTISPSGSSGSGSSSSGGSGSGGGGSATTSATTSTISFSTPANVPAVINVGSSAIGLTQLTVTTNQQVSNAIVTVSTIPAVQLQIAANSQSYQSFQILTSGVTDSQISNVAINFQVNNSWISSNNLDPANISLYRNTGTDWIALPTTLASHDSQYYYFTAISPGFSNYTVLAQTIQCNNGATRCLLNDSQVCSSNVWILSQHCQIGCSDGICITTSAEAVGFFQNALNNLEGFINGLPGSLQLSIGTLTYYFLFIMILSGVVIVSTTLVRTARKRG
jgi:PGF-pre-PGF domain-containing protein